MNRLIDAILRPIAGVLRWSGLLREDLDYHVVRASMVIMYFFFGYQKWWAYEADRLDPFISNGPLIWWLYPAFGHAGDPENRANGFCQLAEALFTGASLRVVLLNFG